MTENKMVCVEEGCDKERKCDFCLCCQDHHDEQEDVYLW